MSKGPRSVLSLLLVVLAIMLIAFPPQFLKFVKEASATPSDNVLKISPNRTAVSLKSGEYYVLKVNITNTGTDTLEFGGVTFLYPDVTQLIYTAYTPAMWLCPSNTTWALIIFNTTGLEGWIEGSVTFSYVNDTGEYTASLDYELSVQRFNPIIRPHPAYLYVEALKYRESVISITVENLMDVNVTLRVSVPEELNDVCVPLRKYVELAPRERVELPILVRPWKVNEVLVSNLSLVTLHPLSQEWRVPVVIVSHETFNIHNYTLFETKLVNRTTVTVNPLNYSDYRFNVSWGYQEVLITCNSTNMQVLNFTIINPDGKKVGEEVPFYQKNAMPGTWTLRIGNTDETTNVNVTINVFLLENREFIGVVDGTRRRLIIKGNLTVYGGEVEKVLYFYVPPSVSSLDVSISGGVELMVYSPSGKRIMSFPITRPEYGLYRINVTTMENVTLEITVTAHFDEFVYELPVMITDFLDLGTKIYNFYVPPGTPAFSVGVGVSLGSVSYMIFDPMNRSVEIIGEAMMIENPIHGTWSIYVISETLSCYNISIREVVPVFCGDIPLQIAGIISSGDMDIFCFHVPENVSKLVVNITSGEIDVTLVDPSGAETKDLEISGPIPGVWMIKVYGLGEYGTFSLQICPEGYNFSNLAWQVPEVAVLRSGSTTGGKILVRNYSNETVSINKIESPNGWIFNIKSEVSSVPPNRVVAITYNLSAEGIVTGDHEGYIIVGSDWGIHVTKIEMRVLSDNIRIRGDTEIAVDTIHEEIFVHLHIQNTGFSNVTIASVKPKRYMPSISPPTIEHGDVSSIVLEIPAAFLGTRLLLINVTVAFVIEQVCVENRSYYVPIVISRGYPWTPNASKVEEVLQNVTAVTASKEIQVRLDEGVGISINVSNSYADVTVDALIVITSFMYDVRTLPSPILAVSSGSWGWLNATTWLFRCFKSQVKIPVLLNMSDGTFLIVTTEYVDACCSIPAKIKTITYLPSQPFAHDKITITSSIEVYVEDIACVGVTYTFDGESGQLLLVRTGADTEFRGILQPFMKPGTLKFIASVIVSGRHGFFILDNNGSEYVVTVKSSPEAQEIVLNLVTDKEGYRSGDTVKMEGTLTYRGNPLSHVWVSISIIDARTNRTVWSTSVRTNETGGFSTTYKVSDEMAEGTYYVNASYGNASTLVTFYVDNTPPTILSLTIIPESPHVGDVVTFHVEADDNISRVSLVILSYSYGGGWTNITMSGEGTHFSTSIVADHEGELKYKVYVYDVAGNIAVSSEKSVQIAGPIWKTLLIYGGIGGGAIVAAAAAYMFIRRRRRLKMLFE
ncbi:MAG: MG2 domain-containing protein [Candidatus Baldrarchaeia archaeon]